jgi:hypothetical protein
MEWLFARQLRAFVLLAGAARAAAFARRAGTLHSDNFLMS